MNAFAGFSLFWIFALVEVRVGGIFALVRVSFCAGLFFGIGPALYKDGEDAGHRDGQQHAGDSEEVAHYAYGKEDEEGVQAGGFAYHFGVDVVGVQLLDQEQAPDGGCGV